MPRQNRVSLRGLRFSLWSLAMIVLLAAVVFSQFTYLYRRALARRDAVERLVRFPGFVRYEDRQRATIDPASPAAGSRGAGALQEWLAEQLGTDMFRHVDTVCLNGREEFSDEDFAATCRLYKLKSLRLGRTAITDEGLRPITSLTNLEKLAISSPHLTDRAMGDIARLEKLQYLSLYEVNVSDAGLAELDVLRELQRLVLRATRVTPEGVAALQSKLPGCEITY